ncbi:hypothetical protein GGQ72_004495 [Rhizobium rhizoryzae]|uniref:Uncharacterized protein n=1 Tax=Rhizobium rhizoryzae TaxID=451876 RepID=A0A7W6LK87_9HYPH|nr:hypothetical protein [Rhizobium rhizoryzae]
MNRKAGKGRNCLISQKHYWSLVSDVFAAITEMLAKYLGP